MALSPVLALPFLKIIARSSVSLSDCAPRASSFSLGRSSSGQSLIVWYEAIRASGIEALRDASRGNRLSQRALFSPALGARGLSSTRLRDDAGLRDGRWHGRVASPARLYARRRRRRRRRLSETSRWKDAGSKKS